jgi:hypothetical protein
MEDLACASVMFLTDQTDRLGRRDFPVELSNPGPGTLGPKYFIFRPRRLTPKLCCCRHRGPPVSCWHSMERPRR